MPIHELLMGTSFAMNVTQPSITARKRFTFGAWAVPKTGTYKGDVGMVIHDTYNKRGHPGKIDTNRQCRMVFLPRLYEKPLESFHARKKEMSILKRPRPVAKLLKMRSADRLMKYYDYKKVKVECTVLGCGTASCTHPGRRYHLKGVTLLPVSGLAIVTQNYFNLDLAVTMPDETWSVYKQALQDFPGSFAYKPELVPIPSSWSFTAGEEVVTSKVRGLLDGTVATICETGHLDCLIEVGDPVLHRVCCLYRRLRKKFEVGDAIRVLQDREAIHAGTDGLVCKVENDYVEVAFDIRDNQTYPFHRNSIVKVASKTWMSYKDSDNGQMQPPQSITQHELHTGGVPFKYLPVYTVARHTLRLQGGRIMDVSRANANDPPTLQVSGLKVLVEFWSGGSQVWFDWDSLRRVSNKRFIQDDGLNPKALSLRSFAKDEHDYFSFYPNYIPAYSDVEKQFLKLPTADNNLPVPQVGMTFASFINQSSIPNVGGLTPQWKLQEIVNPSATPAWDPGSRTPLTVSDNMDWASGSHTPLPLPSGAETPKLASTPNHTFSPEWHPATQVPSSSMGSSTPNPWHDENELENPLEDWDLSMSVTVWPHTARTHWILDRRIRDGLKGMHLGVATVDGTPNENREVQLINQDGGTKILEVSRNKNSVQMGSEIPVTQIPTDFCSHALGDPDTSHNLFIVCRGLHTGKLGRSIKRERFYDEQKEEWVSFYVLQLVEVTPPASGSRNKSYEETFIDSSIRVLGCDLAVVHITKAQRQKYNSIMSNKYR